jgi:hypothetical protein
VTADDLARQIVDAILARLDAQVFRLLTEDATCIQDLYTLARRLLEADRRETTE